MNPGNEVDPEDTARLKNIALACKKDLYELSGGDKAQEDASNAKRGNWAYSQYDELSEWCIIAGVNGKGLDAIDVRLKHAPGIFEIHEQLLQSLEDDLKELQPPFRAPEHAVNIDGSVDGAQPDPALLSFKSFSSVGSEVAGVIGDPASSASEKRNAQLRQRIEDTIRRLMGYALVFIYVLKPPIPPSDIETFILENAKGSFTLAYLLVSWGLELQREGHTQDAIIKQMKGIDEILVRYRYLIDRESLSSRSRTIEEAIIHLRDDPDAERFFATPCGQNWLSWARARAHKPAVERLLHQGANQSPVFLSLPKKNTDIKFRELTLADRELELLWPKYKSPGEKMDRYGSVSPWARNRVKVQVPENTSDYINASPITLTSSSPNQLPLHYIAMQGPTEPSFNHVWRMVAEQTTASSHAVIVQLTDMFENGTLKCDQYFPMTKEDAPWSINDDNIWGDNWKAQLTLDSLDVIADGAIEKRLLVLRTCKEGEEGETRLIWHFLYKRWPDFGVPTGDDLESFLQLIKLSRENSSSDGQRIVHCSAGIGRTGSFIALDHLMRELDFGVLERYDVPSEGPDLVFKTVDKLRQQRSGMVQTEEQYRFIYKVMWKLWHNKYGVVDEEADNHELATSGFKDSKS
ncbi:uncharacterized protein Triagg1_3424 [Trichoderma aggressivum f. europaeum]|uniref:Uncharacterized protein n=1 Tax=Trichoderma aggressivum f. europaeum TaxID=173218 RepID=A0AAE1M4D2_9HYPO|nr:hypothetical protein Triagg1_3424 [Trichoderma aggressivum f. europaeum]